MHVLKAAAVAALIATPAFAQWPIEEGSRERCQRSGTFPTLGMTREEVAASRWGRPYDEIERITASGTTHQWVYRGYLTQDQCAAIWDGHTLRFLFFTDNRLTAIQR